MNQAQNIDGCNQYFINGRRRSEPDESKRANQHLIQGEVGHEGGGPQYENDSQIAFDNVCSNRQYSHECKQQTWDVRRQDL